VWVFPSASCSRVDNAEAQRAWNGIAAMIAQLGEARASYSSSLEVVTIHETQCGLAHLGLVAVTQIKATPNALRNTGVVIPTSAGSGSGALWALRLAPLVAHLAAITPPSGLDSARGDSRADSGGTKGQEGCAAGNRRHGAAGERIEARAVHRNLLGPYSAKRRSWLASAPSAPYRTRSGLATGSVSPAGIGFSPQVVMASD
jgi:hypothetical protein